MLPEDATPADVIAHKNECGLPEENNGDIVCRAKGNSDVVSGKLDLADVMPDWRRQVLRTVCLCVGTKRWSWYRTGPVINLGQLLPILGDPRFGWDAAQVYYYHCTLRIVATKRRKHVPGRGRKVSTGAPRAETRASAVMATFPR